MAYEPKVGPQRARRRPKGSGTNPTKGLRLNPLVVEQLGEMAVRFKLSESQLVELVIEAMHQEYAACDANGSEPSSPVATRLEALRRLIHSPATDGPRKGAVDVPESPSTRAA